MPLSLLFFMLPAYDVDAFYYYMLPYATLLLSLPPLSFTRYFHYFRRR